jgi:hypothetical protein
MYYDRCVVQLVHPFTIGGGVENTEPADAAANVNSTGDSAMFEVVLSCAVLPASHASSAADHNSDDLGRT